MQSYFLDDGIPHSYRNTYTMFKYSKQQLEYLTLKTPDKLRTK